MKIHIDRDDCISCAACWDSCPEVFEESPSDGFSQIVAKYQAGGIADGEAPADLDACVKEAVDGCPVEIIHVT